MLYESFLDRKLDLQNAIEEALKPLIEQLNGQTIYFLNQWDLRDTLDSESDMAESIRFIESGGHLIAILDSSEGSDQVSSLNLDNSLSLLAELEQGSYQTTPLQNGFDASDDDEVELPYSVHQAYQENE